jgi:hypothetical protein
LKRQVVQLIIATVVAWVVLVIPSRLALGEPAVPQSGVAALICLVPTTLTLIWSNWALGRSPEHQLAAVMGGTGIRMLVVLILGLTVYLLAPLFRDIAFWTWLLAFYLFTLTAEMILLTRPAQS